MNILHLILLALAGSLVSILAGVLLISSEKSARKIAAFSGSFAAGALIAAVFFDLLPEALGHHGLSTDSVFLWVVVGIVSFFVLERRLRWFHHHHAHQDDKSNNSLPALLVVGDTLHNALDGMIIGFAYLADPMAGVITTFAVAMHELPQEIGDFGLLLNAGWAKRKVLGVNLLSAGATILAAVITYFVGSALEQVIAPALAVAAGVLLYIALSDIIPEIHETKPPRRWLDGAGLLLIAGLSIVGLAIALSHHYLSAVPHNHHEDAAEVHLQDH